MPIGSESSPPRRPGHQMMLRKRAERDEVTGMPGRSLLLLLLQRPDSERQAVRTRLHRLRRPQGCERPLRLRSGNELIRAVAKAIEKLLRAGELVGRLHGRGGDEFVCLLDEVEQASLDSRTSLLEAALDRAEVPPELGELLPRRLHRRCAREQLNERGDANPAGALFTTAENAMRQRKHERRRSQGRDKHDR